MGGGIGIGVETCHRKLVVMDVAKDSGTCMSHRQVCRRVGWACVQPFLTVDLSYPEIPGKDGGN